MKRKIELRRFCEMLKYADRGSNLAVCFLRQGIPQMSMSEAENKAYSGAELESVKLRVV